SVLLSFSACNSFDASKINNLNDGEVQIIGHAGLGFHRWFPFNPYPSNSFTSIKKAFEEEGAEGIEVDVQMTKDGGFVLYHDNKLESMTAVKGCVSNYNMDDILLLNYQLGYPFDAFQSEKIISFKQLINYLKSMEVFPLLHLDLRTSSDCLSNEESKLFRNRFVMELLKFLDNNEVPKEKMLLISTDKRIFTLFEKFNCPYPTSYEVTGDFEEDLEWAIAKEVKSFTVKPKILTQARSKAAHQAGISIVTFGAKSKSGNRKLLEFDPDAVQTDNLSALKNLLGK
ncbi:MAG: glycerophosphodiester phosphodiesterase, partial [Vicingaceae bacterium]